MFLKKKIYNWLNRETKVCDHIICCVKWKMKNLILVLVKLLQYRILCMRLLFLSVSFPISTWIVLYSIFFYSSALYNNSKSDCNINSTTLLTYICLNAIHGYVLFFYLFIQICDHKIAYFVRQLQHGFIEITWIFTFDTF